MKRESSGPLFPFRPRNLASVKFPAVARVAESGPIIPTYYEYGKPCGMYKPALWCIDSSKDLVTPEGLHIYDSKLWYLMAEYPSMLFAAIISSNMAYVIFDTGENGLMFLKDGHVDIYDVTAPIIYGLRVVGYARTCPTWLGPCIYPYYVYADVVNKVFYPGNYSVKYTEKVEVIDNPPLSMYKQLVDDDADWVARVDGRVTTFKRGGV